jgi:tetratricopeptide (TPR) repeat protein
MKTTLRHRTLIFLRLACPVIACLVSGCMLWTPQWQQADSLMPDSDVSWLVEQAEDKTQTIADRRSMIEAIEAYETVLTSNPTHFETLTKLAKLYVLLGDAYTDGIPEKKAHYRRAMRYSEQALYTQPEFKGRILQGEATWDACRGVGPNGMNAMSTWNMAVLMMYRDCLGPTGRLLNYRWMQRVKQVLERMTRIDPTWGRGFLDVQWGLYYASTPEILGGDLVKSARHFDRAIDQSPEQHLNRWFRARYCYQALGDKQAFIADMQTVAGHPIDENREGGAWVAYCRRNAAESLDHINDYF